MHVVRNAIRSVLALLGLTLALTGLLTITRSTPIHTVIAPGDGNDPPVVGDSLFPRAMALYTGTHFSARNRVEILANGNATYPRLWNDLRAARQTITMQMYYALPGHVADTLRDILAERARAGVRVAVLLDAFGAAPLQQTNFVSTLTAAGVRVAWLRPIKWYTLNRATMRSHSRGVVIDGHIGYTGGFGIADYWLGDGLHFDQWRDTNVRFEGPAVAQLQATFTSGWAEATGVLLTGDLVLPRQLFATAGTVEAGLLHSAPSIGSTTAERYLTLSIAGAQHTLYITNSYFVPDDDFRQLLEAAVRRGVDVRVLTAGPTTDVKTTWYAGRAYYDELIHAGLRIYEYRPCMMHAKTLVVDGQWISIGSMNFDNRSMAFNDETNLVAMDSTLGTSMDSLFFADLPHAKEMTLYEFSRRGWARKVVEWGAEKLWRIL